MSSVTRPDAARLGRWILSWIQPSGALHGFHNHTIWGSNPYRWRDYWSGHSTFSAPLMIALVRLLTERPDPRGQELLRRLVRFQGETRQPNGEYAHIGFQCGEVLQHGLIHNAVPNVALAVVLRDGRHLLGPGLADETAGWLRRSLEVLDRHYPNETPGSGTCNQEYARTWARLVYAEATGDETARHRARRELDQFIADFHRYGLPDAESAGAIRAVSDPTYIEPAEYYGLMVCPLLEAYRIFGDERYLAKARAFARHVVRSSWVDAGGCRRLHRAYQFLGDRWRRTTAPMCLSGSGLTLFALHRLNEIAPAQEWAEFLREADVSYARHQHPAGFFLPGSGWHSEMDVVPCTSWQVHDFLYLVTSQAVGAGIWDALFAPAAARIHLLLGDQCFYAENGPHWAVADYQTTDAYCLRGRKDRERFGRATPDWMPLAPKLQPEMVFPDLPVLVKTDDGVILNQGDLERLEVMTNGTVAWLGYGR